MNRIKRKTALNQFRKDLIGKDSHRGVTLTYSWLANQFGHMALGFVPSFILHDNIKHFYEYENPVYASFLVIYFWFLFEMYNFLGPLLTKRISSVKMFFIPQKEKYVFNPRWVNIAYDTMTDIAFFGFGAFLYSFYINGIHDKVTILMLFLLFIYLTRASSHWYLTKMYQHYANYPFSASIKSMEF